MTMRVLSIVKIEATIAVTNRSLVGKILCTCRWMACICVCSLMKAKAQQKNYLPDSLQCPLFAVLERHLSYPTLMASCLRGSFDSDGLTQVPRTVDWKRSQKAGKESQESWQGKPQKAGNVPMRGMSSKIKVVREGTLLHCPNQLAMSLHTQYCFPLLFCAIIFPTICITVPKQHRRSGYCRWALALSAATSMSVSDHVSNC